VDKGLEVKELRAIDSSIDNGQVIG